jgi:RNA polymerase sigma factor (TIGR02999 family)
LPGLHQQTNDFWYSLPARVQKPSAGHAFGLAGRYNRGVMKDVTRILSQIQSGDSSAAEQLLPLVYDELRKLAAAKLAQEKPGQTLQATALVHDAYIRLVDVEKVQHWDSRGHFFAAAAEAMRRILVESARRKGSLKRGAHLRRLNLDEGLSFGHQRPEDILSLDEALEVLAAEDPVKAELVKLRCFVGMSHQEAAAALGISRPTADRYWAYAKTRLYCELFERDVEP